MRRTHRPVEGLVNTRRGRTARRLGEVILPLLLAPPLAAAVIAVDRFDSSTAEDGQCSLREAILAANNDLPAGGCPAGSGPDTIVLTGDVELTAVDAFDTGTPRVTTKITLRGSDYEIARSTAAATPEFRLFWVRPGGELTIKDTTIRNGGGVTVADGGGFYNEGVLRLVNSLLLANTADSGGGVYSDDTLKIVDSEVAFNSANFGAAVFAAGDTEIRRSRLAFNVASNKGGGLYSTDHVELTASTVETNSALGGAGIFSSGPLLLAINSTISGNTATSDGGGILIDESSEVILVNCTVTENSAELPWGGGGVARGENTAAPTFMGSLIASNTGNNCLGPGGPGSINDGGGNLSDDATCPPVAATAPALILLDPILADNGGPTMTHALQAGSIAINTAGDCGLLTDQRSALRDASCDVGAYESGADDRYEISGSGGNDDTCFGHQVEFGRAEDHLHTADFSDWVWFQPVEGAQYEIETTNLIFGSDTVLELWNGCTPPMLAIDDDGGTDLASKIIYTATENDEIEGLDVLIRDFSGAGENRGYDVTVTCVNDCPICPLGGGEDFVLRDETIVTLREIEACISITAFDAVVEAGARAMLVAGSSIELGNGFTVREDGELILEVDADLEALAAR